MGNNEDKWFYADNLQLANDKMKARDIDNLDNTNDFDSYRMLNAGYSEFHRI